MDNRARTDLDGHFVIEDVVVSSARVVEVGGSSIHDYTTYAGETNLRLEVVPSSFDMADFDDVGRERGGRTIRWTDRPRVYVDTRAHHFQGDPERLDVWAEEIESQLPTLFRQWTGGTVSPDRIEVGTDPPPAGTPGTIVVRFDENPARYPNPRAAGVAEVRWGAGRAITAATIRLRFSAIDGPQAKYTRQGMFAHELGHAMGFSHMDGSRSSVMQGVVRTPVLTDFDLSAGELLYSRPPGNASIDTDPRGRAVAGSAAATDTAFWSCTVSSQAPPITPDRALP